MPASARKPRTEESSSLLIKEHDEEFHSESSSAGSSSGRVGSSLSSPSRRQRPKTLLQRLLPCCFLSKTTLTSILLMVLWVAIGLIGTWWCVEPQERLNAIDTVYLMCQIITTVGYGDLPAPMTNRGFLFYAFMVLSAVMLVAQVVTAAVGAFTDGPTAGHGKAKRHHSQLKPVLTWLFFVVSWTVFFVVVPGEEFNVGEAAYMGVITLTTVGFGDYVPKTEVGKVFACVWMVLGSGAFGFMVSKFGVWTFRYFNTLSVESLDISALERIMKSDNFNVNATARAKVITELLQGFEFDKHHEVSKAYSEKISRNDFLMFMILDMNLVDEDMVSMLSKLFDDLDATGEGYIDRDDLNKAFEESNGATDTTTKDSGRA